MSTQHHLNTSPPFTPSHHLNPLLQSSHQCLELLTSALHILEEVEAGAARTEQHGVAGFCKLVAGSHTVLHRVSIAYLHALVVEEVVQLCVVGTEEYECLTLLLHKVEYLVIVVALVLTTDDEDSRCLHALKRIPASVYIRSFRIVDILHSAHLAHLL